jgi:hypothetical protein
VPPHLRLRLALAACGVFCLGLLVYAVARESTKVVALPWLVAAHDQALLRVASDSLPSFAHAYAFALAGCLWLVSDWRQAIRLGLVLWGVEAGFEVLQHAPIHDALHSPPIVRRLLVNRFDPQDLIAAAAGVAAAWATVAVALAPSRHPTRAEP